MCRAQVPSGDHIFELEAVCLLRYTTLRVLVFLHFTAGDDIPGSAYSAVRRLLPGVVGNGVSNKPGAHIEHTLYF
jgi:hypothetical protein